MINIGIYIYPEAEVLDFSGPFEVFSTASRIFSSERIFNPFLIGKTTDTVKARGGFNVLPHFSINNHPNLDVLVIPGGDHTGELEEPDLIAWIGQQACNVGLMATVCTGIFLLAKACPHMSGQVTTHWEDINDLKTQFPHLDVVESARWIDQGKFVTSAGISAGIDMCLYLVQRLHSESLAERTARQMEYTWTRTTK